MGKWRTPNIRRDGPLLGDLQRSVESACARRGREGAISGEGAGASVKERL